MCETDSLGRGGGFFCCCCCCCCCCCTYLLTHGCSGQITFRSSSHISLSHCATKEPCVALWHPFPPESYILVLLFSFFLLLLLLLSPLPSSASTSFSALLPNCQACCVLARRPSSPDPPPALPSPFLSSLRPWDIVVHVWENSLTFHALSLPPSCPSPKRKKHNIFNCFD